MVAKTVVTDATMRLFWKAVMRTLFENKAPYHCSENPSQRMFSREELNEKTTSSRIGM